MLSDPALVPLIEKHFVPIAIINNKRGKDREVLKRFNERPSNYQVVRFVDPEGKDIIPRKDRVWDKKGIAQRMIAALKAAEKPIPDQLAAMARM